MRDSNPRPRAYEAREIPLLPTRYVLRSEDSNLSGVYLPNRLMRTTLHQYRNIILVTPQGLEPRLAGPKPAVLPLDERVVIFQYVKELCSYFSYITIAYDFGFKSNKNFLNFLHG